MNRDGARILVGEDEAGVARPLIARLRLAGHDVRWERAVRDVRSRLPEFRPHLLVLDVSLDTDGLELFQALRFAPESPPAGVVIMTEESDVTTRERAHQLGAAAVVSKPVDGDRLASLVDDLLAFI
ncbi:MAG: response regulator [Candidatus Dormibacteria bacterium]